MNTEPEPVHAPIIWNNARMMIVLCPFCNNPDYMKFDTTPRMSLCRQGKYEPKGRFDFETATMLMKAREKWNAYKKEWRRKQQDKGDETGV
jgi:hypothetical protein